MFKEALAKPAFDLSPTPAPWSKEGLRMERTGCDELSLEWVHYISK